MFLGDGSSPGNMFRTADARQAPDDRLQPRTALTNLAGPRSTVSNRLNGDLEFARPRSTFMASSRQARQLTESRARAGM